MKILVTGVAGFIGMQVSLKLLNLEHEVIGIDNLNNYYDLTLKESRLRLLMPHSKFNFFKIDICDGVKVDNIFKQWKPQFVIHLAAQAGVRYSLKNPYIYIQSNIVGFLNILEACRYNSVKHLVYASSSSIYGGNTKVPFSEQDNVDHPVSLYAATKKSNELMAHSYSHLYGLPTTGLRFFTVYGPWGRPDMALFLFTKAILEGRPLQIYNNGHMIRDFTYIDDVVECVIRVVDIPPVFDKSWNSNEPDPRTSSAPWRICNIGNNQPVELLHFIKSLEKSLGKSAIKEFFPMQDGDVLGTYADIGNLFELIKFKPETTIAEGIDRFVNWYCEYYNIIR